MLYGTLKFRVQLVDNSYSINRYSGQYTGSIYACRYVYFVYGYELIS